MEIIKIILALIVVLLIAYVGIVFFIEMVKALWNLSPISSIGFVVSVIIVILKGHITIEKLENNLRILVFIFVGTVISYSASSLIPNLLDVALARDFISAVIMGLVILAICSKDKK